MRDVWIIFKKEMREWLAAREGWVSSLAQTIVFVGVFGVFLPLQLPAGSQDSAAITIAFLSPVIGNSVVADSFAGEKERKTLETLLATRLPDWAIFLGKLLAGVSYTLVVIMLVLGSSVVALSVAHPLDYHVPGQAGAGPAHSVYSPLALVAAVGGTVVLTLLSGGMGVFVSMRTASVRAAQQILTIAYLVVFLAIGVALPALLRALPASAAATIEGGLVRADPMSVLVGVLLVAFLLDLAMIALLMRRFSRARLQGD